MKQLKKITHYIQNNIWKTCAIVWLFIITFAILFSSCDGGDALAALENKEIITTDTSIVIYDIPDTSQPVVNIALPRIDIVESRKVDYSTDTHWTFSYMENAKKQLKPKSISFELFGDSIVVLKATGSKTNIYNTFHIRNNKITTISSKNRIKLKMDLQFFPEKQSALPQHDRIQTIPITLTFDGYYSPKWLKVQGIYYHFDSPGRSAEYYTDFHPEVRSGKRRIDMSPTKPTSKQHLVKIGDGIYNIAKRYGITTGKLYKLNKGLTIESTILVGEKLIIK